MNSSTLNRSNLTKEKMSLLKEIKSQKGGNDANLGIYVRPAKEKELDVLWQTFKINQKDEKSPAVYLVVGFIVGAIAMFLMTAVISFTTASENKPATSTNFKMVKKVKPDKKAVINFLPPDAPVKVQVNAQKSTTETYTVKAGDTLDKIIVRFYGKYDADKIEAVCRANNMANPNSLSIGQELVIPLN